MKKLLFFLFVCGFNPASLKSKNFFDPRPFLVGIIHKVPSFLQSLPVKQSFFPSFSFSHQRFSLESISFPETVSPFLKVGSCLALGIGIAWWLKNKYQSRPDNQGLVRINLILARQGLDERTPRHKQKIDEIDACIASIKDFLADRQSYKQSENTYCVDGRVVSYFDFSMNGLLPQWFNKKSEIIENIKDKYARFINAPRSPNFDFELDVLRKQLYEEAYALIIIK